MKSILCVYLLFSFAAFSKTPATNLNSYSTKSICSTPHQMDEHPSEKCDLALKKRSDQHLIDDFTLSADVMGPEASCSDLAISLDNSGTVTIEAFLIDNGSTDGSGGNDLTYELSHTIFGCDEIGSNEVFLTVTDVDGNQDVCSALVTVSDLIAPFSICNEFTVAVVDADGLVSVSPLDVNEGSFDNCSDVSMELDISDFDCSNLGQNVVELTVVDQGGNSSVCWGFVVVEDNLGPLAVCNEFTAATLDANGNLNVSASDVDAGSSDNCSIASLTLDVIDLDCSSAGQSVVELTVTDGSGNTATCQGYVIAEDDLAPSTACNEFTVAELDENGLVSVLPSDVDAGSSDNCSIDYMELDVSDFDCSNIGQNVVQLTVVDQNGNSSLCWGFVVVEDDLGPLAVCEESIYVTLDVNGTASISPSDIDAGSSDNCSVVLLNLSQDQFDCNSPELNTVSLAVTDSSGNTSECSATVIIDDFPDMSLLVDGGTISSGNASDSYQWLDCDNGYAPIAGANEESYTPASSGNYALEFSVGGCTYISECVNIIPTSNADLDIKALSIYPNPTLGAITIDFHKSSKGMIKVYDPQGSLISTQKVDGLTKLSQDLDASAGLYFIEFISESGEAFLGKVFKLD